VSVIDDVHVGGLSFTRQCRRPDVASVVTRSAGRRGVVVFIRNYRVNVKLKRSERITVDVTSSK